MRGFALRARGAPLLLKLFDNVLGREVEVDLGRQQRVMAQQAPEDTVRAHVRFFYAPSDFWTTVSKSE